MKNVVPLSLFSRKCRPLGKIKANDYLCPERNEKKEMAKRLVIFDLDGTLLDTIGDLAEACNRVMADHGYPPHRRDEYRYMVGNGINKLIERALPPEVRTEAHALSLRAEFVAYYQAHIDRYTRPYPGIEALLEELEKRNIRIAVASNKYQRGTEALVARYFPGRHFAAVFGQRENIPVKPDPQIVRDVLAATGICREETLYIGDSGVDMQTASRAGVVSVGVAWGFRPQEELKEQGADFIARRAEDILEIVLS